MTTGLVRYDAMLLAIAEAHAVDEVKDIRDKAMALERYAAQAMNTDAERKACEIRLRAERRAGEMLRDMEKAKGGRPENNPSNDATGFAKEKTLDEIGISRDQSSRWQKLAAVPVQEFEQALSDPETKPTTTGIIKKSNGSTAKMHPDALWLWGRTRDFEKMRISDNDPVEILGEMTETMQADMARIIPVMVAWLTTFEGELDGRSWQSTE